MDQPLSVRLGADVLTVATDERAAWNGVLAPLLIGLYIFTAATVVGPASGGSFNAARSLAPVLFNQDWGDVWIYIVGPLAGAVVGGAVWALVCLREGQRPTCVSRRRARRSSSPRASGRWPRSAGSP